MRPIRHSVGQYITQSWKAQAILTGCDMTDGVDVDAESRADDPLRLRRRVKASGAGQDAARRIGDWRGYEQGA